MKPGYAARNPVTGGLDLIKTNPAGDEQEIEKVSTTVDAGLGLFAVKGVDDKWISVLGNYSMHYVGDCENGTITADYFGVFSKQIAKLLNAGEEFVGMMSNGTSGEVNVWDFLNRNKYPSGFHEKTALIGTELAEKAALVLNDLNFDSNPVLASLFQLKELRLRKPNHEELEAAKRIVSAARFEALEVNHEGYEGLVKVYAREQILLNEYPDSKMFSIQALRIGDGVIGGLGGEFFSETGLKLKKESGASNYFTICMANDYVGYVPPAHEIEKGGYETWRCRTSHLAAESESIVRNTLKSMIESLAKPAHS